MAPKYDGSEIVVLKGLEAVRKRPGMYIGSVGSRGLHHLIWEILDNGIDEHLAGFCNEIEITMQKDGGILGFSLSEVVRFILTDEGLQDMRSFSMRALARMWMITVCLSGWNTLSILVPARRKFNSFARR